MARSLTPVVLEWIKSDPARLTAFRSCVTGSASPTAAAREWLSREASRSAFGLGAVLVQSALTTLDLSALLRGTAASDRHPRPATAEAFAGAVRSAERTAAARRKHRSNRPTRPKSGDRP